MNALPQILYSSGFKTKCFVALELVREYGWTKFIRQILPWNFARRYFFYSEPLESLEPVRAPQLPFRIEVLAEKDLPLLLRMRPNYYALELLRKRLEAGHFCFIGWTGDAPIYLNWIFVQSLYLPYLRRTFVLSPGEIYVDEVYTVPEFRRRGVFSYAGYLVRLKLCELGYKRFTYAFASWQAINQITPVRHCVDTSGEIGFVNLPGFRKCSWKGSVCDDGDGKISLVKS